MKKFKFTVAAVIAAAIMSLPIAGSTVMGFAADSEDISAVQTEETAQTDISEAVLTLSETSFVYTGEAVVPDVTVKLGDTVLEEGKDYMIAYANNTEVGYNSAEITVTGTGEYTGEQKAYFSIMPGVMKFDSVSTQNDGITLKWTKDPAAVGVQVLYSTDSNFVNDVHSTTVTNANYVNLYNVPKAGETYYIKARAFISSDGTASGKRLGVYGFAEKITVLDSIKKVTIPSSSYTYTGSAIKPAAKVKASNGRVLTEGKDYTVLYRCNTKVGTAQITVRGKGSIIGKYEKTFIIKPNDISDNRATIPSLKYEYYGEALYPTPTLKINGRKLVRGVDYLVSYQNNDKPGTATVTLTGLGSYKGETSRTFEITTIKNGKRTKNGSTYYYDGNGLVTYYTSGGSKHYPSCALTGSASAALNTLGYRYDADVPAVKITSASQGSTNKKITLKWSVQDGKSYSSFVILRSADYGKSWTVAGTADGEKRSYTNSISNLPQRWFIYSVVGLKKSGSTTYYGKQAFAEGWAVLNICLDPGHYIGCNNNFNYSSATVQGSYHYSEGTQMLLLGEKLRTDLTSYSFNGNSFAAVRMTRSGNGITEKFSEGVRSEAKDFTLKNKLETRGIYAKGCDFFISLHTNAAMNWNESNLWRVMCFPNLTALQKQSDLDLAYELGKTVSCTIDPGGVSVDSHWRFGNSEVMDRRCSLGTYYAVNRGADSVNVPGILLEHSFHTNPAVRAWLLKDSNLEKLASAEAKTILKHYGFPLI